MCPEKAYTFSRTAIVYNYRTVRVISGYLHGNATNQFVAVLNEQIYTAILQHTGDLLAVDQSVVSQASLQAVNP